MTTTNTNANIATNAEAAARVTLKSALEAGDVKALAVILAKIGGDKDGVSKLGLTFSLAVKDAKEVLKEQAKAAEESARAAADRREAKKAERLAEVEKRNAEIQTEKENMLKFLMDTVNGMGLDLEAAEAAANAAITKKYGDVNKEPKYTFTRIPVVVDGKQYNMPTSGNMVQVLKDAMTKGGYTTHKDFILAHAVDKEAAAEAFAE